MVSCAWMLGEGGALTSGCSFHGGCQLAHIFGDLSQLGLHEGVKVQASSAAVASNSNSGSSTSTRSSTRVGGACGSGSGGGEVGGGSRGCHGGRGAGVARRGVSCRWRRLEAWRWKGALTSTCTRGCKHCTPWRWGSHVSWQRQGGVGKQKGNRINGVNVQQTDLLARFGLWVLYQWVLLTMLLPWTYKLLQGIIHTRLPFYCRSTSGNCSITLIFQSYTTGSVVV